MDGKNKFCVHSFSPYVQAKKDEKMLKRRNIDPEVEIQPLTDANQHKVTESTSLPWNLKTKLSPHKLENLCT